MTSALRLTNWIAEPASSVSKKVNCRWYRSTFSVGSPRMVKYSAGTSAVAFANIIWCARVVFPDPGAPAIRFNEYSGRPPPSTASRPGTPLGRLRIGSRALRVTFPPVSDRFLPHRVGNVSFDQFCRHVVSDEPSKQFNQRDEH